MNASNAQEARASQKSCLLHIYESKLISETRISSLVHKAFTIGLVVFYFTVVEQIPTSEILM